MVSGGASVGGEIVVNIRTEGGGGIPGAGGTPRPVGGGAAPKDPGMSLLNNKQKEQLENMRGEKKALKEYQDFQKLKQKEGQSELLNELQRGRKQATMVAGAVTTGMLARNSKIMQTSMGAIQQMFGAFIDIFLMPFIPLIIPVLKYIAELIPRWQEWTQKFADLFAEDPIAALQMAGKDFLKLVGDAGVRMASLFGISETDTRQFYTDVGTLATTTWGGIQTAWETSVTYLQDVWETSNGNLWTAVQIVATDAWTEGITPAAKAAWTVFEKWQPITATAIETAWGSAASYVSGVWEASGCSVMGSIGIIGRDAMNGIGAAGIAAWNAFKSWQPGVASSIEAAFCGAVNYITGAWAAGGGTITGFFGKMATDVGGKILDGFSWLWSDDGGGMKQQFVSMWRWITDNILDKIGDYLQDTTGKRFGLPKSGVTLSPATTAGGERGISGLGGTGLEMGADLVQAFNLVNPQSWGRLVTGWGSGLQDIATTLPWKEGGAFGGKSDEWKAEQKRSRIEETFKEQVFGHENLSRIMQELRDLGVIEGQYPDAGTEERIETAFANDSRFSGYFHKVNLFRANGRWTAEIFFKDTFPQAEIDGFGG